MATLVALLVFGAAVPQAIFPLLAAAEGITADATANLPADAAGNPLLDGPLLGLDAAGLLGWTAVGLGVGILAAAVTLPVTMRRPSLAELRAE